MCGECQVASAVGLLCPECVREATPSGAKRAGRATRVLGRRIGMLQAPVTTAIIAISAVVFVLQLLTHYFASDQVTLALWYAPLYSMPEAFEPWRMATVMFTHSTGFLLHILFNMYALWLFGRELELRIGRTVFAVLYLFAGLGGSLGVMLWGYVQPETLLTPTVGASGAIFGVMGAVLVGLKAVQADTKSLLVMLAINVGIGFLPGARISWQAHLGGLLVGALTMFIIVRTQGPRKRGARITFLIIEGLALVALSFAYFVVAPAVLVP